MLPIVHGVSSGLKKNVLAVMHSEDAITTTVLTDKLILKFGEGLYGIHGTKPHLHSYIGQKMRTRTFSNKSQRC